MKGLTKTKKMPDPDLETVMPLLIGVWRRFTKLGGPSDVLQTRNSALSWKQSRSCSTALKKRRSCPEPTILTIQRC